MQSWRGLGEGRGFNQKKTFARKSVTLWLFMNGEASPHPHIKGGPVGEGLHTRGLLLQHQTTRPALGRQSFTMPSPALLCCLVLLAGVGASRHQSALSEDNCTHFPASLPHMLRELRAAFGRVKTFFVSMMPSCPSLLGLPPLGMVLEL